MFVLNFDGMHTYAETLQEGLQQALILIYECGQVELVSCETGEIVMYGGMGVIDYMTTAIKYEF